MIILQKQLEKLFNYHLWELMFCKAVKMVHQHNIEGKPVCLCVYLSKERNIRVKIQTWTAWLKN